MANFLFRTMSWIFFYLAFSLIRSEIHKDTLCNVRTPRQCVCYKSIRAQKNENPKCSLFVDPIKNLSVVRLYATRNGRYPVGSDRSVEHNFREGIAEFMTGYCEKTSRCGKFEHPASVLNSDRVVILRYWRALNTEIMIDFVVTVRNEIHTLRDNRNIPSDEIVTAIKKDRKNFEGMARINRVLQVKKKNFRSTRPVMNDILKQNNNNSEELPFTLCNVGTNRECLL
jgi:hypothetical protein